MDVRALPVGGVDPIEREVVGRVAWRLMPLLMLGWACAFLDRANVGMAALTMNHDLGFSNAVFGFGAGLFFLGYFLAEIPSNLILNKLGARRWFARILITWGIAAGLTAFVWNDWSFYGVRIVLGVAEAGYLPGVVLYLTWWFPSHYRARMFGLIQTAAIISAILGPPVGGLIMQLNGLLGLHGWQWLFLLETLPSLIMSVVIWQLLTDKPADAAWLRPEQRTWLAERIASERAQREAVHKFSLGEVFRNAKVWLLTLTHFGLNLMMYGLLLFLPLIVRGLGASTNWIGAISALPFLFALVGMNYWGWHSDRTGERTWHVAGAYLVAAAGLVGGIVIGVGHPVLMMMALIVATTALWSGTPAFWALPSALLTGTAAAGGIALINSVANLGGWVGPWVFGLVKDASGSDTIALLSLALAPIISAIAVTLAGHDRRMERIPPHA